MEIIPGMYSICSMQINLQYTTSTRTNKMPRD